MLKIVFSQGTIGRCVKGQDGHQANISSPENRLISGTVPCFGDISSLLSFLFSDLFSIMGEKCGTTCSLCESEEAFILVGVACGVVGLEFDGTTGVGERKVPFRSTLFEE